MKKITNFFFIVTTFIATVFARKEVGRPNINGVYYACYDDGKATLTSCKKDVYEFTIPATVKYQGKRYQVTMVQANAFNGRDISIINVDSSNKALLLKRNAFNGIFYLREFRFNSKKTEPEIDAFGRNGVLTYFSGPGVPYAMEKLIPKYLKKWKLPVGKNYTNASGYETMRDLFLLAKNFQRNFGVYDKSSSLSSAVDITFNGSGNVEAYARLYRIMAIFMGIPENEIMVGNDTIHQCWNYVKVDNYTGEKRWYVVDASKYIDDNANMDNSYFQYEKNFINNTLKQFYGEYYTLYPHNFIVYLNKYNYPGESSPNPNTMDFDSWLVRNGGNKRTL